MRNLFYKLFGVFRFIIHKNVIGKGFINAFPSIIGFRSRIIKIGGEIELSGQIILLDYCKIKAEGSILLGSYLSVNNYSRIIAKEKIIIGNNVTIAQFVTILDHDHNYYYDGRDLIFKGYKSSPINIGNNVWIADKVTILKGVNIGNNVIIGANSLVNKDIPSNCIAAGNPCRVIKILKNE